MIFSPCKYQSVRQPQISVVMPVYNTGEMLRETIDSVLAQTHSDFELIIVDDGSQSETSKIAREYSDPRIRYYYQENRGMATARNRGVELAQGEYIAFLDHDDVWLPEKLEKQLETFHSNPSAGIVFSPVIIFDSEKSSLQPSPTECSWKNLVRGNFIHTCSCVMIKRKLIVDQNEYFDPICEPSDDYDLWLRIGRKNEIVKTPDYLVRYRIHANNTSGNLCRIHKILLTIYPKVYSCIKNDPEYSFWQKLFLLGKLRRSHAWVYRTCSMESTNQNEARNLAWQSVRVFPAQPANLFNLLHTLLFSSTKKKSS